MKRAIELHLKDGNAEVRSFLLDLRQHAAHAIEQNGTVSSVNCSEEQRVRTATRPPNEHRCKAKCSKPRRSRRDRLMLSLHEKEMIRAAMQQQCTERAERTSEQLRRHSRERGSAQCARKREITVRHSVGPVRRLVHENDSDFCKLLV